MLLAKLDIKNKLVLIFQEGMNKKNIKNEVKKSSAKKTVFFTSLPTSQIIMSLNKSAQTIKIRARTSDDGGISKVGGGTNDQIFFIYNQGRQWRNEKF